MAGYRVKKKTMQVYDSGLDADDEADVKLLSPLILNKKSLSLSKRQFLENVHNNNRPLTPEIKSKSKSTSKSLYREPVPMRVPFSPVPRQKVHLKEKNDGISVKSRLLSLIQDLAIHEEEKPQKKYLSTLPVPVIDLLPKKTLNSPKVEVGDSDVQKLKEHKGSKKRKKSRASKSKPKNSQSTSLKSPNDQTIQPVQVQPVVLILKPLSSARSPIHASKIRTNMSLTQFPHSWGQLKLIQTHLPPWKQVDPYLNQDEGEEENMPKRKRTGFLYPSIFEYPKSSRSLAQSQPQNKNLHFKSSWTTLQTQRNLSTSPTTIMRMQIMSRGSRPSAPNPVSHKQCLVPLPQYPTEYSNLCGSAMSKKKFQNVKREYPRPWVLPVLESTPNTISNRARKDYEDENDRARRILRTMWQKEEEEKREAQLPNENKSDNRSEALKKITSEMAMIDRLLKEISGDKNSNKLQRKDIFHNYVKERQELEKARDMSRQIVSRRPSNVANAPRSHNKISYKASFNDQSLTVYNDQDNEMSPFLVANKKPLSRPVFDSDFDLPDILKPNFEYLYQADLRRFQEKNSKLDIVSNGETKSIDGQCEVASNNNKVSASVESGNQNTYRDSSLEWTSDEMSQEQDEPEEQLEDNPKVFTKNSNKSCSRTEETRSVVPNQSYTVPIGQRAIDKFFPNNYPNALESSILTPLEPLSPYIPPPNIEHKMVDRFFTSTNSSRNPTRLETTPIVINEFYAMNTDLRDNDRFSDIKDLSKIFEYEYESEFPESESYDEDYEKDLVRDSPDSAQSLESIKSSKPDPVLNGSWTLLPTVSDEMLLQTHEATEEWFNKMAKINSANPVPNIYPIMQTLFTCAGTQNQVQNHNAEHKPKEEPEVKAPQQNIEEPPAGPVIAFIEKIPPPAEVIEVKHVETAEIHKQIKPSSNPISIEEREPPNTKPALKSIPRQPTKIPVVKHVKPWNAPIKPAPRPKREPYVPPKPTPRPKREPFVPPKPAPRPKREPYVPPKPKTLLTIAEKNKQRSGSEPKKRKKKSKDNDPRVPDIQNNQGQIQKPSPTPTPSPSQSRIPRSLQLESVIETYSEPQKPYRIQEFVSNSAKIKNLSHILRGRVVSAPPDLHLDFSSSLIDIRVPTAKDFNQVLRGCKSFFF